MAAGRHRRPPAWRRAISGVLRVRTGVGAARTAALHAEVLALRATVDLLRADLDRAVARESELAGLVVRLAAPAAEPVQPVQPVQPMALLAPPALELPLVRLALERETEPPLTREMAIALASPDRGQDTALVRIVLADLPEHSLLDPVAGRGADLQDARTDLADLADLTDLTDLADLAMAPETVRRSA